MPEHDPQLVAESVEEWTREYDRLVREKSHWQEIANHADVPTIMIAGENVFWANTIRDGPEDSQQVRCSGPREKVAEMIPLMRTWIKEYTKVKIDDLDKLIEEHAKQIQVLTS